MKYLTISIVLLTMFISSCSEEPEEIIEAIDTRLFLERMDGIMWRSGENSFRDSPLVYRKFMNNDSNVLESWNTNFSSGEDCYYKVYESFEILDHTHDYLKVKKTRFDGLEQTIRYRANGMGSVVFVKYYGYGYQEDESKSYVISIDEMDIAKCKN